MPNPIAGAWFRMEKGEDATPPKYEYDEFGIVIEGMYLETKNSQFCTIDALF